jgi:hypothetical protein
MRATGLKPVPPGVAGATGECNDCRWWRRKGSKKKGVRIPGGFGKCIRPQGQCGPKTLRRGSPGGEGGSKS